MMFKKRPGLKGELEKYKYLMELEKKIYGKYLERYLMK